MKKSIERYTCTACGVVADSDCPEKNLDSPTPRGWFYGHICIRDETGKRLEDQVFDACCSKCVISLLTKSARFMEIG